MACADSTSRVIPVMPLSAASIVLIARDMESNRPLRSEAWLLSDAAVKKLVGLSSAELTRLPVARRTCVAEIKLAVRCNCNRLVRTPAESTTSLLITALRVVEAFAPLASRDHDLLGLTKRRHDLTFLVCTLCALDLPCASEQRAEYRHNTLTSREERWLICS